ncbi:MAG: polyprotein [Hanko iflavirus 2]|nr:MAG: polyprotein [Hanko iflavirus 2]
MAFLAEQIARATMDNPYSSIMRNYLDSHVFYATRQVEFGYSGNYYTTVTLYRRVGKVQLFHIKQVGTSKKKCLEECYKQVYDFVRSRVAYDWKTQGLDSDKPMALNNDVEENVQESSQQENVIIEGAEVSTVASVPRSQLRDMVALSTTEKVYTFADSASSVVGRWMPMSTISVGGNDGPDLNEGLVKSWKIFEDMADLENINVLPLRGFMLGKFELEFKLVLQTTPFQAMALMFGYCPNPYGLYGSTYMQSGIKTDATVQNDPTIWPHYPVVVKGRSYLSLEASIQRPHVILDVTQGGEAILRIPQKYQRVFARTFDATTVEGGNPGVRGGFTGMLTLHALSKIQVGTGTASSFNARIFYRFSNVQVTAMTKPVVKRSAATVPALYVVSESEYDSEALKVSSKASTEKERAVYRAKWRVQGPAMSMLSGVKTAANTASAIIETVENIGGVRDRRVKNQDKPNDAVHQMAIIPRPRLNFTTGEGIDSACIVGLNWVELSEVMEQYNDEPKSYKDLVNMNGILANFNWTSSHSAGTTLWSWSAHPTDTGKKLEVTTTNGLAVNDMTTPLQMVASGNTNYRGTMVIYGQFVKTFLHKGAIEVSITYARTLDGDAKENSYVKIINVQDCSGFEITVPYIFDTPMRTIDGSSIPMILPNVTWPSTATMFHSTVVSIRVLNQLLAPDSVSNMVPVILYLKGGQDFCCNYPRPFNSVMAVDNFTVDLMPAPHFSKIMGGDVFASQYHYVTNSVDRLSKFSDPNTWIEDQEFKTQGADFEQPEYTGNILTTSEHMNFKSILKQPIKIISNYEYKPTTTVKYPLKAEQTATADVEIKNYLSLPVAPLSRTFVEWLSSQLMPAGQFLGALAQSHQFFVNSCFGQYCGGMMYTIVVDGTAPVYYAYAPHDKSGVNKLFGPLAEWQYRGAGSVLSSGFPNKTSNLVPPMLGHALSATEDLASGGLFNGIIVPAVNPTEKIEINQSIPLPWVLMNRNIARSTGTFTLASARENSEWYNGKLYIWSDNSVKITIYQNNPDCFELGGFLGHPGFFNPYPVYAVDDNRRQGWVKQMKDKGVRIGFKTQGEQIPNEVDEVCKVVGDWKTNMLLYENSRPLENWKCQGKLDFRLKDLASAGWKSFMNFAAAGVFTAVAHNFVPEDRDSQIACLAGSVAIYAATGGVANAIQMRRCLDYDGPSFTDIKEEISEGIAGASNRAVESLSSVVRDTLTNVAGDLMEVSDSMVQRAAGKIGVSLQESSNMAVEELRIMVNGFFPQLKATSNMLKTLWGVAQHLVHAALARTWSNAGFAVFGVLVELDLVAMSRWKDIGPRIEQFYAQAQQFVTQGPNDSAWSALMQILTAVICGKLQVRSSGGLQGHLKKIFWGHDYRSVQGINSILSLTRTVFSGISTIVNWAFKEADPNIALITALQNQGTDLEEFATEANEFLTFFAESDINKRDKRIKYLAVILRAIKIREVLIRINNHNIVGPLMQICNKVIEKANAMQYILKCDLVKQEPFVFCLAGDPEVGKSFSIYYLMPYLLKQAKFKLNTPDYIYTINCALDYFNGLRSDHIAWWFDDIWNLKDIETIRSMCNILYGVMTSAPYNVPRAELENKEQLGQPVIMGMTTNNPFVTHPEIPCPQAIWRRRHVLAQLQLKGKKKISDYKVDDLKQFEHLEVVLYSDVTVEGSLEKETKTFTEFAEHLAKKFCEHLEKEAANQQLKYEFLMQCMTKNAIDMLNIGNPFDLLRKANDMVPVEVRDTRAILEDEVAMLVHEMRHREMILAKLPMEQDEPSVQGFDMVSVKEAVVNAVKIAQTWFAKGLKETVRCHRCASMSHHSGVTLWCETGSHYLCLACATLMKRTEAIETLMCPMHPGSKMQIKTVGVFRAFLANYMDDAMRGTRWASAFMAAAMNSADSTTKGYVEFLKYIRHIYGILLLCSRFMTQGVDIGNVELHWLNEAYVSNSYYPIDNHAPMQDLKSLFIELQEMNEILPGCNYICQHSLLMAKHVCVDGEFILPCAPDVKIKDNLCEGVCILADARILMIIRSRYQTSQGLIDEFMKMNKESIRQYWPRYLWPKGMAQRVTADSRIAQFLSTDWWVEYKSRHPVVAQLLSKVFPILAVCGALWVAGKAANAIWEWIMQYIGWTPNGKKYNEEEQQKRGRRRFYRTQGTNFCNKLDKICRNYAKIRCQGKVITAWGLKGSTFLIPSHLSGFVTHESGFEILLMQTTDYIHIDKDNMEIAQVPGKDLIMVSIKRGRILFADCTKFLQKRPLNHLVGHEAVMLEVDRDGVVDYTVQVDAMVDTSSATDNRGRVYENTGGIMYSYQKPGLCGSLLCVDTIHPIVSMHISGSQAQDAGIGVVLYQDDFTVQGESLEEIELECADRDYGEGVALQILGRTTTDLASFIPTKTELIRSPLAECLSPCLTMPAFLAKGEGYQHPESPLYYGVRKNGILAESFPEKLVSKAYSMVRCLLLSGNEIPGIKYKVYDVEEAICGLNLDLEKDGDVYFGHVPLDTSAGWPYSTTEYMRRIGTGLKNKMPWVDVRYGADGFPSEAVLSEIVKADHEAKMLVRSRGEAAFNVFQDCLKDERRPIAKAMKEGGTRLFSMSNFEGTIALRRYTLCLVNHLRFNRIKNGIAIGINPESMEWHVLALTLKRHTRFFTLDFSNFGASLEYNCGMEFATLMQDFCAMYNFGDNIENISKALMKELMGSYHIAGNVLYKTFGGSPSGACITGEINSFVHMMYMAICWLIVGEIVYEVTHEIVGKFSLKYPEVVSLIGGLEGLSDLEFSPESYRQNFVIVVYGDDGVYSIDERYADVFNAQVISQILAVHNLVVTNASKQAEVQPYFGFEECEFLKRKFVKHPLVDSFYCSQMRWDVVEELVKWMRKKPLTPAEACFANAESSLMFAFGHGEERFIEWKQELEVAFAVVFGNQVLVPQIDFLDVARKMFPDLVVHKF